MTDQTAPSYVDQYAPPAAGFSPAQTSSVQTPTPSPAGTFTPDTTNQPLAQTSSPAVSQPTTSNTNPGQKSQSLEDQNIFHLLGVAQASETEKEAFLDELQQVIWEDFLANDVDLLVTEDEKKELTKIMAGTYKNDLEQQEAIVVYLEKLIPDLEEIMLEKALELKGEMVKERIAGMKEFFANQPEKLSTLAKVEEMLASELWHDAAESLNHLSNSA